MKKIFLVILTFLLIVCAVLIYDVLTNKSNNYPAYINEVVLVPPPENGIQYLITFSSAKQTSQILQLMEARKQEFNVKNISIFKHGDHAIVVQAADFIDLDKGLSIINRAPSLEIKLIDATKKGIDAILSGKAIITAKDIKSVKIEYDKNGRPIIYVTLKEDAAWTFYDITRENIGKRMSLIVDGRIVGMPVVKEGIPKGIVRIEGEYDRGQEVILSGLMYSAIFPPSFYVEARQGKRNH